MLTAARQLARRGHQIRSFGALTVAPSKGKVVKFEKEDMAKVEEKMIKFRFNKLLTENFERLQIID